ncbi:MAG: hypothetical protein QOD72_3618 [Acidimicrobiaceae bacterium]|jgi:hypothetical protein|nr:hypothetical protein [Acidimicrobiaceae bacterium]
MSRKLTVADIADLRAYERDRPALLRHVMDLKSRRRIGVGPIVTFVFENRDTIRFQVQEMARVERLITDESIQTELDTYNPLVPECGQLSATLFVELTTADDLREWLPKLVGIERAARLRLTDGAEVPALVETGHEGRLTRRDITSTVHYVRWEFTPVQVDSFASGPVMLALDHPAYERAALLTEVNRQELLADLRP